jgi:hypothetical protein
MNLNKDKKRKHTKIGVLSRGVEMSELCSYSFIQDLNKMSILRELLRVKSNGEDWFST